MSQEKLEPFDQEDAPQPWEKEFLQAYTENYGVAARAARSIGVHPRAIEMRCKQSPRFKALYEAAQQMVKDTMRYEAMRRALEPTERPVFQRGELVGVIQEWDTRHLQWMLERMIPEEFHLPTRIEFGSGGDGAVNFELKLGDSPPELNPGDDDDE